MKKFLSAVLAGAMVLSVASMSVFAADQDLVLNPHIGDKAVTDLTELTKAAITPDNTVNLVLGDITDAATSATYATAEQLADKDYFSFKVKKNDGSKIIKSAKLVEKKVNGAREHAIEIKFNEDMTDTEYKVDLDFTFSAKAKAAADIAGVASGDKVLGSVKFWVKNDERAGDQTFTAGTKGVFAKPAKNDENEVVWADLDKDLAKLTFEGDSDAKVYYPKLSTKWDNSVYAEKFADQDAFIFSFVGNPTISSTARATLTIFNPYVNDDDELTVDEDDIVIYEVVDGELVDVTSKFSIEENEDGEYVLVTKTRTLGTYIVAEAPAAVADEAAEVPAEDGKAVPDTGR